MDALKSLMSTMADVITGQVSEQVRRAMEAATWARPHPPFDYPLVHEGEPSRQPGRMLSPYYAEHGRVPLAASHKGQPPDQQLLLCPTQHISNKPLGLRKLNKALHELGDKGQINRFLKRGPQFLQREQEPAPPPSRDEECLTEVVATTARGYAEGITRLAWKAQLRNSQQVLTME
ncbi:hypothetical protein Cgig2_027582 [Carnegiea gigantea]|uniref:Uncharacterized protein n=1 Tax=Carnegiea gigantea TaxID=171969 RepID=A0A9Q1GUB6_9CARY|nr:hypothetical protein Cgig2_027582 [Carnegiea gigantea]